MKTSPLTPSTHTHTRTRPRLLACSQLLNSNGKASGQGGGHLSKGPLTCLEGIEKNYAGGSEKGSLVVPLPSIVCCCFSFNYSPLSGTELPNHLASHQTGRNQAARAPTTSSLVHGLLRPRLGLDRKH